MYKNCGNSDADDGALALTDKDGCYEINLPCGLYRRNHAILSSYGTDTLECYVMELPLQQETRLDFRIGQAEVAKLASTPVENERCFSVRFICWTIHESLVPKYDALKQGRALAVDDPIGHPNVRPDEVAVFVDDRPAKVHAFTRCPVQCMRATPVPGYHLECTVPEGTARGRHVLKVVVHHVARLSEWDTGDRGGRGPLLEPAVPH